MNSDILAGRRILLVEDEMVIAMMLEDLLESLGCVVAGRAARPDKALEALQSIEIDAAILDVNLNGEDSFAVAAELERRDVPFVFSTGYGPGGLKPEYANRPILAKPFREEELARTLAALLAPATAPDPAGG